jgi:regulator of cell morphogenesis and NO signaling
MNIQPSQTLREIAAQSAGAVRILEDHGIDYCCGGQRSFEEACREKGLDWQLIAPEIEAAGQTTVADQRDWNTAPLSALIRHILAVHHNYEGTWTLESFREMKIQGSRTSDRQD